MRSPFYGHDAGLSNKKSTGWQPVVLAGELDVDLMWNDAALVTFLQQTPHRFATALAVIECQVVDPHRDKAIGQRGIHFARKLHRVFQSIFAMIE